MYFRGGVGVGFLVVRLVPYQTSQKQKLLTQKHDCLRKAREIKQTYTVEVISKLKVERVSNVLKSSKHYKIWFQMKEHLNIQNLLFEYSMFFLFYVSF